MVLLVGANPASNHPRLITQLIHLRRRGGKVIVVNPLSELGLRRFRLPSDVRSLPAGSQVSDLYLQPRIGGDIALFTALLKLVDWDEEFVGSATPAAPQAARASGRPGPRRSWRQVRGAAWPDPRRLPHCSPAPSAGSSCGAWD